MNEPGRGEDQRPAIRLDGVSIAFGGVHAVQDVSLRLREGEILGLIGPNGAGKTTLLNLISGHARASTGRVEVQGKDVTRWPLHRRSRLGLARSYQTANIFPGLTAGENVRLAAQAAGDGHYRLLRRPPDSSEIRRRSEAALAATRLEHRAGVEAAHLSHGETRALEVAMLVATGARVLLLDEPAAGMAFEEIPGMVRTITSAQEQMGAAVIIVEHKMSLIFELCDRIAVLDRGQLIATGSPPEVARDARVRRAYLGEAAIGA
jgi:branched-chain amino acid transport system ATP-binding protein